MKKGTVIGIITSALCILALMALGIYLMLDTKNIKTDREAAFSAPMAAPQTETRETEAAAEAMAKLSSDPDSQTAAALLAAQAANSSLPEHQLIFVGDSRTVGMGNAEKQLGDGYRWKEIYEFNRDSIRDPGLIYPGQEFVLPAA